MVNVWAAYRGPGSIRHAEFWNGRRLFVQQVPSDPSQPE